MTEPTEPTGQEPEGAAGQEPEKKDPKDAKGQEPEAGSEPEGQEPKGESAEVAALRKSLDKANKEAAKYRNELKTKTDAELSEIDRAKKLAQENEEKANKLQAELNQERRRSRIKSLATKAQAVDAELVASLVDSEDFMSDDGKLDEDAIKTAITALFEDKPFLKGDGKPAPSGTASGTPKKSEGQLSRDDLKTMTADEIETARKAGRLDDVMAGKS